MKAATVSLSSSPAETLERLCYFLLLLFLPTQLGKHFWPDYALVSGFRVDYLSPTLYVTDILILILFFIFLFRWRASVRNTLFPAALPYLLVLLFLFLTILPARSVPAGLYSLGKVAEYLFFGWYTSRVLASPALQKGVTWIIAVTVMFESLLALAQVSAKGSLGGVLYWVGERTITSLTPGAATAVINGEVVLRPYATFSHPNVLAGFLLLGMSWVLLRYHDFPSPAGLLRWGSLGLGSLGLLSTLSRIPILLWGVLLAGYLFSRMRIRLPEHKLFNRSVRRWQVAAVIGSVLAIGAVLLPLLVLVLGRFSGSSLTEESLLVRVDLTRIAWQLIQSHPVLGVGLGNFLLNSALLKSPETPLFFAVQPVHNMFLLVLAETGILGLFLWCWFLFRSFRHAAIVPRVILFLILFLGLFDHYFLTLQQGQLLLAFYLGTCWIGAPRRLSNYASKV